jgi:polyisoprenoid-binding protein YceI
MNRTLPMLVCVAAVLGLPAANRPGMHGRLLARERYVVDPGRSRLTVETQTSGLSSMFGHDHKFGVRKLAGEASLAPGALETGVLELTVEADSLWLMEDVGEANYATVERALNEQVLESARYPRIVFRARTAAMEKRDDGAFDVSLAGELALHGVKRKVTVPATVTLQPGGLRATGAVEIRQTDFKIVPFAFAAGTVRVKDRVLVSFDLVANRDH